jgi:tetratricopeptide (TPR) repeat protein
LTLIATAPGSDMTFANQIRAGELAESVLDAVPDHPGAHHYVIHAYDVPALADRALAAARSYGSVAPENAHALHMTSHIFTRLGLWDESIDFNRRSAAAALDHPVNGATSHHYLHALDYLAYAYLQIGDDAGAARVVEDLEAMGGPVTDNVVSAYAFAAVPARVALERQEWNAAARIPAGHPERLSWASYPHLEAITQFARALGAAHLGDLDAAHSAVERLGELRAAAATLPDRYDWATQVEIQRLGASAWTEYVSGRQEVGLAKMRRAVELEATTQKHPVTPGEALPASELLGDMLLDMGGFSEAVDAYDAALVRSPNRLNSLYGSGRASELAGDVEAARERFEQLLSLQADRGVELNRVAHARTLVAGR